MKSSNAVNPANTVILYGGSTFSREEPRVASCEALAREIEGQGNLYIGRVRERQHHPRDHAYARTKMALQRYFLHATKQYMSRGCLLQSNLKQTYCEIRHKYSHSAPRKYTDRHEWVIVEKDTGTVGISKYAQESLGDVVFAQLPDPGTKVNAGDEIGALESVKAASEIYSPVTGVVLEKNKDVEKKPALINTSCYDKGWLFKMKLTKLEELDDLMSEEQYETFLKTDVEKPDS